MAPFTVFIAGSTGNIGKYITNAFLAPEYFPKEVVRVVALTRDVNSAAAQELKAAGADVQVGSPTVEAFKGVDVFVNAFGHIDPQIGEDYLQAAIGAGCKVYFPNAYGFDAFTNKIDSPIFTMRRKQLDLLIDSDKVKVICLSNSNFMNFGDSHLAKAVGFDHEAAQYTIYGDPNSRISFTHLRDISASIVRLSVLAMDDPSSVPTYTRIVGDTLTVPEIAEIGSKKIGKKITITAVDPGTPNLADFVQLIRWAYGSGVAEIKNDHNELVNPGEKYWKWTKLAAYVDEDPKNAPFGTV